MKDEFSVNELEPVRDATEEVVETTQNISNEVVSDAALLNQEAANLEEKKKAEIVEVDEIVEDQGPTLKEVIANSVNPDYQGPTAKEIVVNSVKVDNTKKKNYVGLIVLIIVLVLVGGIVLLETLSDDNKKGPANYLKNMPDWVLKYNEYLNEEYEGVVAYNIAFLDLDFDDKPEAVINYLDGDKTLYDVIDVIDNQFINVGEVSDILMMYSFTSENVNWYINTSFNDNDLKLIDINKRFNNQNDFEINLSLDTLAEFKSNHFNISYDIEYTKISFRTVEKDLASAVKVYEKENESVDNIVKNVIDKYSDGI